MEQNLIHYGISTDYLQNWGLKEALREVYQNFMDYGEFIENKLHLTDNVIEVSIRNEYSPKTLEFLRIGTSQKENKEAVGKHGEGLKMAALIFLREDLPFQIITNNQTFKPVTHTGMIGDTLALQVEQHTLNDFTGFSIVFAIDKDIFEEFRDNIIEEDDIIFKDPYHGAIVEKDVGNIYVGGLFVCNLDNFSKAYNFSPTVIPLDRDRAVPREFDVNYHSSKVNEAEGKWKTENTTYDDMKFVAAVPQDVLKQYKPIEVAGQIEYVSKKGEEQVLLKNESIKAALNETPLFKRFLRFFTRNKTKGMNAHERLSILYDKINYMMEDQDRKEFRSIVIMLRGRI